MRENLFCTDGWSVFYYIPVQGERLKARSGVKFGQIIIIKKKFISSLTELNFVLIFPFPF